MSVRASKLIKALPEHHRTERIQKKTLLKSNRTYHYLGFYTLTQRCQNVALLSYLLRVKWTKVQGTL